MSKGRLRCCGSPLFLKSKYSSGYNLVLTKRPLCDLAISNEEASNYETSNLIKNLIESIIPESTLNENLNSEMSFILPAQQSGKFAELFEKLDENRIKLRIDNIGISISTLEDVFLK